MLWLIICHECEIIALYVVHCECDSFRGVPKLSWLADELCWLGGVWTVTRQPCRRQSSVRAESCWLCCAVVCGTAMCFCIIISVINMYIVYDMYMYLYVVHCLIRM